jgi:hypothetical protein
MESSNPKKVEMQGMADGLERMWIDARSQLHDCKSEETPSPGGFWRLIETQLEGHCKQQTVCRASLPKSQVGQKFPQRYSGEGVDIIS